METAQIGQQKPPVNGSAPMHERHTALRRLLQPECEAPVRFAQGRLCQGFRVVVRSCNAGSWRLTAWARFSIFFENPLVSLSPSETGGPGVPQLPS